ncbi:MAG TPA: ABC transporter ATP-binding protein [Methylomirabilota bacterium]|nr:ABC transporter ATP-binding protein [Methylomirabilota bacterium]
MAEALLALHDIVVAYDDFTALDIPSLDVHAGEILALIGPNGAGKSTLLRVMGLLQVPSSGTVLFQNQESTRKNSLYLRRRMASVFQEPLLLNAAVYDNAALGLKLRGLTSAEMKKELRPWLERLGISHLSSRRVRTLSGGEAQRTSLARALVLNPELLFLDEPFSALDQPTRDTLIDDLRQILRETGITTVLVTHNRDEAFSLANRVGILIGGRILQLGSSSDVFTCPQSESVAEIVGFENRIPGVVKSIGEGTAMIRFSGGTVAAVGEFQPGTRVILCIRAEDVRVNRCDDPRGSSNQVRGQITNVSSGMLQYRITVKTDGVALKAAISRKELHGIDISEGVEVTATFQPNAVHLVRDLKE